MDVLLASNNAHKLGEFRGIFRDLGISRRILQPRDIGFSFDVVEDGESFGENAMKKARAVYRLLRGDLIDGAESDLSPERVAEACRARWGSTFPPVLADDSGICVHALGNEPGIRSARFGNTEDAPPLTDAQRNRLLLDTLSDRGDRGAHYVCNAVVILDEERFVQAQEIWYGAITTEERAGDTGFGYDPIFLVPEYDATVAQIPQETKDRISHRAKAIGRIARALAWAGA